MKISFKLILVLINITFISDGYATLLTRLLVPVSPHYRSHVRSNQPTMSIAPRLEWTNSGLIKHLSELGCLDEYNKYQREKQHHQPHSYFLKQHGREFGKNPFLNNMQNNLNDWRLENRGKILFKNTDGRRYSAKNDKIISTPTGKGKWIYPVYFRTLPELAQNQKNLKHESKIKDINHVNNFNKSPSHNAHEISVSEEEDHQVKGLTEKKNLSGGKLIVMPPSFEREENDNNHAGHITGTSKLQNTKYFPVTLKWPMRKPSPNDYKLSKLSTFPQKFHTLFSKDASQYASVPFKGFPYRPENVRPYEVKETNEENTQVNVIKEINTLASRQKSKNGDRFTSRFPTAAPTSPKSEHTFPLLLNSITNILHSLVGSSTEDTSEEMKSENEKVSSLLQLKEMKTSTTPKNFTSVKFLAENAQPIPYKSEKPLPIPYESHEIKKNDTSSIGIKQTLSPPNNPPNKNYLTHEKTIPEYKKSLSGKSRYVKNQKSVTKQTTNTMFVPSDPKNIRVNNPVLMTKPIVFSTRQTLRPETTQTESIFSSEKPPSTSKFHLKEPKTDLPKKQENVPFNQKSIRVNNSALTTKSFGRDLKLPEPFVYSTKQQPETDENTDKVTSTPLGTTPNHYDNTEEVTLTSTSLVESVTDPLIWLTTRQSPRPETTQTESIFSSEKPPPTSNFHLKEPKTDLPGKQENVPFNQKSIRANNSALTTISIEPGLKLPEPFVYSTKQQPETDENTDKVTSTPLGTTPNHYDNTEEVTLTSTSLVESVTDPLIWLTTRQSPWPETTQTESIFSSEKPPPTSKFHFPNLKEPKTDLPEEQENVTTIALKSTEYQEMQTTGSPDLEKQVVTKNEEFTDNQSTIDLFSTTTESDTTNYEAASKSGRKMNLDVDTENAELTNSLSNPIGQRRSDILINESAEEIEEFDSTKFYPDYFNKLKQYLSNSNFTIDKIISTIPSVVDDLRQNKINSEDIDIVAKAYGKYWPDILALSKDTSVDMLPLLKMKTEQDLRNFIEDFLHMQNTATPNLNAYDYTDDFIYLY